MNKLLRTIAVLALVVAGVGIASAQPGPDPSPYPPPPPAPAPPPAQPAPTPYPPPPVQPQPPPMYGYRPAPMPVQLSFEDRALLARGEISDGEMIGGIAANFLFGFGIGQAVQGRWSEKGWIFTLGEGASIGLMIYGLVRAIEETDVATGDPRPLRVATANADAGATMALVGLVGYLGFHVWSLVDAATGPADHNRRVRELRMRLGMPLPMYTKVTPYVAPTTNGGGVAGLTLRF